MTASRDMTVIAAAGRSDCGPLAFEGHCGTEALAWPALAAASTGDRLPRAICAVPAGATRRSRSRVGKVRDAYSVVLSLTGCGGTVSGAGGAAEPSFRCRFSSFFCFLRRSLWRLANA